MSYEDRPLNLRQLKQLIRIGISEIPVDHRNEKAVLVIGDTGVGKSTIINFLSGDELIIKFDGLKPTLDSLGSSHAKIGHQKFSETSIPTKVVINDMAFYDCPGFKDNKCEEQDIANSFYVQRLLNLYPHVKIVLVVDESHISQARADKMPKLLRNLLAAFHTFQDIKDGICMVVNRAGRDNEEEEYHQQLLKMCELRNQNGPLFLPQEQKLLRFLVFQRRILLFKQAPKKGMSKSFIAEASQNRIIECINQIQFVRGRHITNIISENAKLAIRDFIDEITQKSNRKIETICGNIINSYKARTEKMGKNIHGIMQLKADVVKLGQRIKRASKQQIVQLLQQQLPRNKMEDFQEDFASVLFFRDIYDKTATYFSNLVNKIYSQLSYLLTILDQKITVIQREEEEEQRREQQRLEQKMREQKAKQERLQWEKKEQERIERERLEAIRRQQERKQQERLEKLRIEQERVEREKQQKIRIQQERLKQEKQRIQRERLEAIKRQEERVERERQEALKRQLEEQKERQRQQQIRKQQLQKQRRERQERERQERLRKQQQQRERQQRLRREQQERERQERLKREQQERERQERLRRQQQERESQERLKREQQERERQQRLRREQKEKEKQQRLKREQQERERQQRLRREQQERERQQRLRREKQERERQQRIRIQNERRQQQRLELERIQRQRLEAERAEQQFRYQNRDRWNQSRLQLMEKIQRALIDLNNVEEELTRVKTDTINLQSFNKKIQYDFTRIEQTYFTSTSRSLPQ